MTLFVLSVNSGVITKCGFMETVLETCKLNSHVNTYSTIVLYSLEYEYLYSSLVRII